MARAAPFMFPGLLFMIPDGKGFGFFRGQFMTDTQFPFKKYLFIQVPDSLLRLLVAGHLHKSVSLSRAHFY